MTRIFLAFAFLFSFPIILFSKGVKTFPKDSLYSSNKNYEFKLKTNSAKASQEELASVIDSLLDLDVIPTALVNEIRISSFQLSENILLQSERDHSIRFPSSGFYSCWETNNLFPEKDLLKMKGDTSFTIKLNEQDGEYFHPFNGVVTSDFGWRDSAQHNGIDIRLKKGDKVSAAFDGMVRVARNYGGFGNVVIIRHYNGLETVYAHFSKIKVKPGQVVLAGQVIGLGGSTGVSTGPHLHFEVRFKGVPINPKYLISFTKQQLLGEELVIKKTKWGLTAFPKNEKTYVIERGDTWFGIAKHFGTSSKAIKEMNGYTKGWVMLKVGQKIKVAQ